MLRFLIAVLLLGWAAAASADTIVLTNGRRIDVEQAWEEGDVVKGNLYGSTVQYPRGEVARILTETPTVEYQQLRFGLWELGMTQDQVLAQAKSHSIQLRSQDAPEAPGIPSDQPQETAAGLRYEEELLGRRADVGLQFTPESRTLWRIRVVWRGDVNINRSRLKNDILNRYRNEYGSPDGHLKHSWFSESIHWEVGGSGSIRLKSEKGVLELAYSDGILEDLNERERAAAEGSP